MVDAVLKLFDRYDRRARFFPALLTLGPLLLVAAVFYFERATEIGTSVAAVGFLAVGFLLSSVARTLGKSIEKSLFHSWNGKPTTQILRHVDTTLDVHTKSRYHQFLASRIGVVFPTKADEQASPAAADAAYEAGTKWLLEETRDAKLFPLLLKENISYGFWRNLLGLKPVALVLSAVAVSWVFLHEGVISRQGLTPSALLTVSSVAVFALLAIGGWSAFLVGIVTKKTVRQHAFSYADMLCRSCDVLGKNLATGRPSEPAPPTTTAV